MVYPKKLAYSSLDNKSMVTFSREFVSLASTKQDDEYITRNCFTLLELNAEMDLAFSRSGKSQFTEEITSLEKRKRTVLVALRAELYSNSKQGFISASRSRAATTLYDDFKKVFKNSSRSGVKVSSAEVNSFVRSVTLREEELKLSGVGKMVEMLMDTQNQLDSFYKEKIEYESQEKKIRQLRYIRSDMEKRIKALLTYIQINSEDLEESYSEIAEASNSLIVDFMGRLRTVSKTELPEQNEITTTSDDIHKAA